MKNLLKISILSIFVSLFFSNFAFAIERVYYGPGSSAPKSSLDAPIPERIPTAPANNTSEDAVPNLENPLFVPSISVQNAKIVSQKDNTFNISFDLVNSAGLQTGVKYSVLLNKGQFTYDQKFYDGTVSLTDKGSIHKDVVYTAPSILTGDYELIIASYNQNGIPFGTYPLDSVKLVSSVKGIEIDPSSCSLEVSGIKIDPLSKNIKANRNTIETRADINSLINLGKDQSIKLTCSAVNSSDKTISVKPFFETHNKSPYGEVATQEGGSGESISFKSLEKKTFSVTLPKATTPKVYSIDFSLKSVDSGSNTINMKYSINGLNASVDNVSLDKDFYKKGDIANIAITWSSSDYGALVTSVDPKINPSPISIITTITNDKSKPCSSPLVQNFSSEGGLNPQINAPVPITSFFCTNPQATIVIKDTKGNILDQKTFSFETKSFISIFGMDLYMLIAGILIIGILTAYFVNLKKKKNETNNQ